MNTHIAVAQFAATTDKAHNRGEISRYAHEAASHGAQVIVFPENSMYSHPDSDTDLSPVAEPSDGEFVQHLTAIARSLNVTLVAGMTERLADTDRVSNTVIAVGPSGDIQSTYRKLHLYDAFGYKESAHVQPGQHSAAPLFTVDGEVFGIMTCYDLRFPETGRRLVDAGARVLIIPAAWVAGPNKEDHWTTLLKARAIENTSYVVAAGQTGPVSVGQSMIVDPLGVIRAAAGESPGIAVGTIDVGRLEQARAILPVLENRRFTVVPA